MLVTRWQYGGSQGAPRPMMILPDGCRDLILEIRDGEILHAFQTELDWCPHAFIPSRRHQLIGYGVDCG